MRREETFMARSPITATRARDEITGASAAIVGVVSTGGTIGSAYGQNSIQIDPSGASLRAEIDSIARRLEIDVRLKQPLNKGSDDMSPSDWRTIWDSIQDLRTEGVSDILVTHGTDTLCYSAYALDLFARAAGLKIAVTGAFYPLAHPKTDARINLEASLALLKKRTLHNGAHVVFKANSRNVHVIPARAAKPIAFDQTTYGACYGEIEAVHTIGRATRWMERPAQAMPELSMSGPFPSCEALAEAKNAVVIVPAHPGLNLNMLSGDTRKIVIIEAYHSGTASSETRADDIAAYARNHPDILVALTPLPSAFAERPYETTIRLMEAGVVAYKDLLPHHAYVFCVIAMAQGKSLTELKSELASIQATRGR